MSRGAIIRRLDQLAVELEEGLGTGPLDERRRDELSRSLQRTLKLIADDLQGAEDAVAAVALLRGTVAGERRAHRPS